MRATASSLEATRASMLVLVLPACVDVPTTSFGLSAEKAVPANTSERAPTAATTPARIHVVMSLLRVSSKPRSGYPTARSGNACPQRGLGWRGRGLDLLRTRARVALGDVVADHADVLRSRARALAAAGA